MDATSGLHAVGSTSRADASETRAAALTCADRAVTAQWAPGELIAVLAMLGLGLTGGDP